MSFLDSRTAISRVLWPLWCSTVAILAPRLPPLFHVSLFLFFSFFFVLSHISWWEMSRLRADDVRWLVHYNFVFSSVVKYSNPCAISFLTTDLVSSSCVRPNRFFPPHCALIILLRFNINYKFHDASTRSGTSVNELTSEILISLYKCLKRNIIMREKLNISRQKYPPTQVIRRLCFSEREESVGRVIQLNLHPLLPHVPFDPISWFSSRLYLCPSIFSLLIAHDGSQNDQRGTASAGRTIIQNCAK